MLRAPSRCARILQPTLRTTHSLHTRAMPVTVMARPAEVDTSLLKNLKYIDIGVNLTDPVFRGKYHGKKKHEDDLEHMLERARKAGVKSMIITGTSLRESREALKLAKELGNSPNFIHVSNLLIFFKGGPDAYLQALDELIAGNLKGKGRVVALGECGLDYDRLHFASQEVQQKHFRSQLSLAKKHQLPLFLHSRAAHGDFVRILREEGFGDASGKFGVVHSFTGSLAEAAELMTMGFHLSINGCSLKTEENLKAAATIRSDRILLETDAPWCSMTGGHASKEQLSSLPQAMRDLYLAPSVKPESFVAGKAVKGRNEPCATGAVAWAMHKLLNVPLEKVAEKAFKNTLDLFGLEEDELDF
ncbi:unnamed protein product [Mycena citricolor]|uniref:Mg-dependent DNase n=1 Tax=Mycena citricolor TaxID=2018698 RepID=A0AAD2JVU4_9AGAR|nr:unnamed protein product [Mycena citricolor]